jgi:hypothetical protein
MKWWGEKDSNLRTRKRTDLQSVAVGHLAISPKPLFFHIGLKKYKRAGGGIRTPDQLITNQLLWPAELHRQKMPHSLLILDV